MKVILAVRLFLICFEISSAQVDKHGNPVFNSETISSENYGSFEVSVLYYTIANNISNKKSSVYMSDNPSLKDYINFSAGLPSYGFMISANQAVQYMVMVMPSQKEGKVMLLFLNSSAQKVKDVMADIPGEITEGRANELIKLKVDKNAEILNEDGSKKLSFNNSTFEIIPFDSIKKVVLKNVVELMKDVPKNPVDYIRKESIGGELDYLKKLDPDKMYAFDNIVYSQPEAAIFLWAKSAHRIGMETEDQALVLWQEIYKKEMTAGNKKAFHAGFISKQ